MSLQPATKFQAPEETHKLSMVLYSTMIFKFTAQINNYGNKTQFRILTEFCFCSLIIS